MKSLEFALGLILPALLKVLKLKICFLVTALDYALGTLRLSLIHIIYSLVEIGNEKDLQGTI